MTKYYRSPRWSAEFPDCSMPLTFDQYSVCSYGCLYCFALYTRGVGQQLQGYHDRPVHHVNAATVADMVTNPNSTHKNARYFQARKVLQWGGMSDPFCNHEKRYGVGLELLKMFRQAQYPICFSTKGTWWTKDPRYVELFRGMDQWNVKFSIITADPKLSRGVEVGCPPPVKRLKAIETYSALNNGGATLRLRPFIPGISDGTYEQLIRDAANAGATALSTEFYCVEGRSRAGLENLRRISLLAGFDLHEFYKKFSVMSGYYRLNRNVKRDTIDRMEQLCKETGLRFYVSDAHFKERCHNGSCCGLPESWNYSRGQFTEALVLARKNGVVYWSQIEPELAYLGDILCTSGLELNMAKSERRALFTGKTAVEYLHHYWNNPNEAHSPYRMFEGIVVPEGTDENGDVIYRYNPERA